MARLWRLLTCFICNIKKLRLFFILLWSSSSIKETAEIVRFKDNWKFLRIMTEGLELNGKLFRYFIEFFWEILVFYAFFEIFLDKYSLFLKNLGVFLCKLGKRHDGRRGWEGRALKYWEINKISSVFLRKILILEQKNKKITSATGFEPVRAKPIRFRVWLLNHSDKLTTCQISAVFS